MKQIILILAILIISSVGALSKTMLSGSSNTFLEDYQLTQKSDNLYELTYSNSTEKFTIEVCPKEAECCYLVRGDKLEVMYLCNEAGLGLRKMPESQRHIDTSEYCKLIDCKSFMYQSLLTQKKKNTKHALGLIACFFPEVINNDSREIVFNPSKDQGNSKLTAHN